MKKILKKCLTQKQCVKLVNIRRDILKNVFGAMVRRLPPASQLDIKAMIEIKKKIDYRKQDILLLIDSDIESDVRLHSCEKEPEMINWIETFFKAGDIVYDVGANIGAYSLVAAKFSKEKIKIYAFEPGFINFSKLCNNIMLNNCQKSIIPLQIALCDKTGIETFNYSNLSSGAALHTLGDAIDFSGEIFEPVFKQQILSYRMDELINIFKLPVPNHIKIDVDGIELKILKGSGEILKNKLLKSVLVELQEGTNSAEEIINLLVSAGLKIHSKHRYVYGNPIGPTAKTYNYIFKR